MPRLLGGAGIAAVHAVDLVGSHENASRTSTRVPGLFGADLESIDECLGILN